MPPNTCVAQFMVIVDMTVVNVALPSIGRALHFASTADLQWVVTAYVLFSGGLVLLGGRLADLLGGRRVFLLGLPGEVASNPAKAASYLLTALHVLIGVGLIVGTVLTMRRALGRGRSLVRLAVLGGVSVGVAFAAGILTMSPGGGWWSYLMAVGFMAALGFYGTLYLRTHTAS